MGNINIQTFDFFHLNYNDTIISNLDNRSQKAWLLLAYLVYFKDKSVPQSELISALWKDADVSPSTIKTTLHRLRHMLKVFGEDTAADLIQCQRGYYSINSDYTLVCDFEEFESYYKQAKDASNTDEKLALYEKAFSLYKGEFLSNYSNETWVIPITIYFHNLYLEIVISMLHIYEEKKMYNEAIDVLKQARSVEKYEETIYIHLIRTLIHTEKYKDAVTVYNHLTNMLDTAFGVQPSSEAKSLCHEAMTALSSNTVDIQDIPRLMLEKPTESGALLCDFDFFKEIYHAYSRGMERSNSAIHLVLINITDMNNQLLSKRSQTCCVNNLKQYLQQSLRSGDIVSMCTPSQFVLLLPNATAENAETAIARIKNGFFQKYPHSPAKLTHFIQPVTEYKNM